MNEVYSVDFKNKASLWSAIEMKIGSALDKTADYVKSVIDGFIREYYHDYPDPKQYERTWQFLNSCVKSQVLKTSTGYEVEIYIDTDSLNYKDATGAEVATWANKGLHGSKELGSGESKFWDQSMEILHFALLEKFKEYASRRNLKVKWGNVS